MRGGKRKAERYVGGRCIMSKYKGLMLKRGVMQKDVAESVRRVDPRVDTALMSKFVNDVCLPTPPVLNAICKTLSCAPLDIYDPREIALAPQSTTAAETPATGGGRAVPTDTQRSSRKKRFLQSYRGNPAQRCRARIRSRRVAKIGIFKRVGLCASCGGGTRRKVIHNHGKRKSRRRGNVGRQSRLIAAERRQHY